LVENPLEQKYPVVIIVFDVLIVHRIGRTTTGAGVASLEILQESIIKGEIMTNYTQVVQ